LERYHRVAASQGIEARHPFLDRRLVDFCLALPWELKVRDGWSKLVVRRATAGLLPDDVRWRRGRWVRLGPKFLAEAIAISRDLLAREMSCDTSELEPYVDLAKLKDAAHRYFSLGDPAAAETVWTASALSSWLRETSSKRYDPASRVNGPAALSRLPLAG
jgi:asparagine synthase (glutamine-hydrolysing)